MKITILVDNHAGHGLVAEHGLSLWIETEGMHILFDTGQGSALETNARALGVELSAADILVLSHGHYDHTGAMARVLERAPHVDLYCHPGVVQPRFSIRDGKPTPIQMPRASVTAIEELAAHRLHWIRQPTRLSAGIGMTGSIPRETGYEDAGGPFYLDREGRRSDPNDDDLALWIREGDGLVVCVGCSHAGVVNTLSYVQRLNDGLRVRAVIGGFHLLNAEPLRIEKTVGALRLLGPDMVIPCHCTGEAAVASLHEAFGERVSRGESGFTFQL